MDIRKINHGFSVSPQIAPADLVELQRTGFRSIICNRPDGEDGDQPSFAEIEAAARAVGLEAHHLPVVSGRLATEDLDQFKAVIPTLPGPVLAYCRSGTRSITLWALTEARRGTPVSDILAATQAAGYDISGALHRLENGG